MQEVITKFEARYRKPSVAQIQSGDTVRVAQQVKEGKKERVQAFEGLVIRTKRMGSLSAAITVRRVASGVGVEKTYLLHSPTVVKVQILRRSKVRRNFLSYLRERTGKASRLAEIGFDREAANVKEEPAETEAVKPVEAAAKKAQSKAENAASPTQPTSKVESSEAKSEADDKAAKAAEKKAKAEAFRQAQAKK